MAFRDLLLHVSTYPEATPSQAIDRAVHWAMGLGGTLSVLALTVDIPVRSNRAADALIGLTEMAREEEAKSRDARDFDLSYFVVQATTAGVLGEVLTARARLFEVAEHLVTAARTRDLCILPLGAPYEEEDDVARSVIFNSGRPVLLFRGEPSKLAGEGPQRIVVAWDGSRCAARAMADAMPMLVQARDVQLLAVGPESVKSTTAPLLDALRHLKAHGVRATVHEIAAGGRSVGAALETELRDRPADLLVMGAYGHSRLRELVLGGATEHMIRVAPTPIFLSH